MFSVGVWCRVLKNCLLLVGGLLLLNELEIVSSILLWLRLVMLMLLNGSICGLCGCRFVFRCWVRVWVLFDLDVKFISRWLKGVLVGRVFMWFCRSC